MIFSDFEAIIKEVFDDNKNQEYHNLQSWSSMQSLLVVSTIDEHYDVLISYEELKKCKTLQDVYKTLCQKINS